MFGKLFTKLADKSSMSQFLNFSLTVSVDFKDEDGWVIACCEALDLYSQGRNQKEAEKNIIEAIQGFLESCYERNVLEQSLKECGFQPAHGRHYEPQTETPGKHTLHVPLTLLAQQHAETHSC